MDRIPRQVKQIRSHERVSPRKYKKRIVHFRDFVDKLLAFFEGQLSGIGVILSFRPAVQTFQRTGSRHFPNDDKGIHVIIFMLNQLHFDSSPNQVNAASAASFP
ncbi:hypothetical protein D3C76_241840 [compost metagenome]